MKRNSRNYGLLQMFLLLEMITVLGNTLVSGLTLWFMVSHGILDITEGYAVDGGRLLLYNGIVSIPIGLLISLVVVNFPFRPIRELIDGMDRLGSGDFKTRVNVGAIMRRYSPFVAVAESFNKMAEQT